MAEWVAKPPFLSHAPFSVECLAGGSKLALCLLKQWLHFLGVSEMPGGRQLVSVQSISRTKALRSKSTGLIYFVYFAEEIALPWTESPED